VCAHKNEKQCANRYFGHKFCFKRKGVAEAKIEVLEYVELIGSASQNGNNIYVFYLQKENADHTTEKRLCSLSKRKRPSSSRQAAFVILHQSPDNCIGE